MPFGLLTAQGSSHLTYTNHQSGARGEALAIAYLVSRGYYAYKCFQDKSPVDIVALKMQGNRKAESTLFEVRYQSEHGQRPHGLNEQQRRNGIKLMIVHHDGHVEIDPAWSLRVPKSETKKGDADVDATG